ncbi:MAG TPA: hypothetical protein VGL86_04770 [Polyangia bacterium]|jgi:hypothetical protein
MTMKTKKKMLRLVGALALATLAACGNSMSNNGSPDMAMTGGGGADMAPTCVTNPTTGTELLNACTTAATGDPAKDAPYFPSLAPNGNLPPLP